MIKPYNFSLDYGKLKGDARYRVTSLKNPRISWSVLTDGNSGSIQTSYNIKFTSCTEVLWDSGWVESGEQSVVYAGKPLPIGQKIEFELIIKDDKGNESQSGKDFFYMGQVDNWEAKWIAAAEDVKRKSPSFNKTFNIDKKPEDAYLLVCGIGYHKVNINGKCIDESLMDPAYADYSKTCYYVLMPELAGLLEQGENTITCAIGEGWRRLDSDFISMATGYRQVPFSGTPQLTAQLYVKTDGEWSKCVSTDETWTYSYGPLVSHNLYDGDVYDARISAEEEKAVKVAEAPGGKMVVQSLEPIRPKETYKPLTINAIRPDTYIIDFGQNMAGYISLKMHADMVAGQEIEIKYAELLKEDGDLFTEPLREAKCTDLYICSGDETDDTKWEPGFTYHGFRYVKVSGYSGMLTQESITAIAFYTDIEKENSFFKCGNPLVNAIHHNVVMCEKSNLHSILSDCPQRNERMAWMNDATVRFEETPYNFDIGRLFPKVVRDIIDAQTEDGMIGDTAPYIVGGRPADPVCSSFLVAGLSALMHTGNTQIISEAFDKFKAWEDYLLSRSDDYIVNYSYYGDWASPAACCINDEDAKSAITPGILMSTGYSYYNCKQLAYFASILGKKAEEAHYSAVADKIRDAFLDKWFDTKTGKVATGSQACQTFPLWLGIIPEEYKQKAIQVLREDLLKNGYKLTTGNLCSRYIFDVLTQNGCVDDAWEIITGDEYPSLGYMIQNEATTVWERFELKKNPSMNSHNHPMYGAVDYWLYAYVCGIKPTSPGWKTFEVKPYLPKKLLSAHAQVETPYGNITVKWLKQYGKTQLYVTVPFGTVATVEFGGKTHTLNAGFYNLT